MMQRVRVGLTGLAVVFLLVLLAAAIFGNVEEDGATAAGDAVAGNTVEAPTEPLAELGVTPGAATTEETPDSGNAAP